MDHIKPFFIKDFNKDALKVMLITPFYKPSIGGVEYIVYYTARELLKRGFEVHIVSTTYDNRWKRVAHPGISVEDGIIVHRLEPSGIKIGYSTIMKGLKKTLQKIRPDIVHCHNMHPHLFQALRWKEEFGFRLIAQLHYPTATGIDHMLAKALYRIAMYYLVRNQRKIDAFIAHTNMEARWLMSEGIGEKKIQIIRYPGIPDEMLNYNPTTDIHERLAVDKVIAYVSRLHPRKGQHLLIEAAVHLKEDLVNFKIYIAGPVSDPRYLGTLKDLIKRYKLEEHVVLDARPLPEKEKLDVIATSDVFACTPLRDLHPIVILEALALKTPVVATAVGAIPELLDTNILLKSFTREDKLQRTIDSEEPLKRSLSKRLKRLNNTVINVVDAQPFQIKEAIARVLDRRNVDYREEMAMFAKLYTFSLIVEELANVYDHVLRGTN